jgi:plastocyanin
MKHLASTIALFVMLALPAMVLAQPAPSRIEPSVDSAQMAGGWVTIVDFAFQPYSAFVSPGALITWTNTGAAPHTVTSTTGAFGSGIISPGGDYSVAIEVPGAYDYYCTIHPSMAGTLIVY